MMLGAVMKCLCSVKLRPGADDPTARLRSVQDIVNSLHGLQTKIYKFVRDRVCSPQVNRGGGSGGRVTVGAGCDTHGDLKLCPGKSFHVECSFLPQMLREVNLVFEDVKGLELDDFASRKVPG